MTAMFYPVAMVTVIELCFLLCRSGNLTMAAAMKRATLAAIVTGIVFGYFLKPEGTDSGLTFYFLGIALLVFVMAMIPATVIALLYALLLGRSRDD